MIKFNTINFIMMFELCLNLAPISTMKERKKIFKKNCSMKHSFIFLSSLRNCYWLKITNK